MESICILDSKPILPVALAFMATSCIAFAIMLVGKRFIPKLKYIKESDAQLLIH